MSGTGSSASGSPTHPSIQTFTIKGLLNSWIMALTRPSVQTYDTLKPQANSWVSLITVVLAGLVSATFAVIGAAVIPASEGPSLFPAFEGMSFLHAPTAIADPQTALVKSFVSTFVTFVVYFYVFIFALQFLGARFGGSGTFKEQAHLIAVFDVPRTIVNSVLGVVPYVGLFTRIILAIYGLILMTFAVSSAQRVRIVTSIVVWLVGTILSVIVVGILAYASAGWL